MRRDEGSLEDIRNAARRCRAYVEGMSRAEFLADDKTRAAVVRELEIMGEAASRLSNAYRAAHPEVDWVFLIRVRNFYIHVYDAVNYGKVWSTVTRDLPGIEAAVAALLPDDELETE